MGKTYLYDCPRCNYRAKVSGGAADGLCRAVQTIECLDCKALHDVMVRVRVAESEVRPRQPLWGANPFNPRPVESSSIGLSAATEKLLFAGLSHSKWVDLKVRCPVSKLHRTRPWMEPGKCPRCGAYLERTLIPYRIWD